MIRVEYLEKYYDRHSGKRKTWMTEDESGTAVPWSYCCGGGEWLRKDDSFKVHQRSGLF